MQECLIVKCINRKLGGDLRKSSSSFKEASLGKAAKKAENIAAEGLVSVLVRNKYKSCNFRLNSQTDFVAKNMKTL